MSRTWGIKLGSSCAFGTWCRKQIPPIVGIGWRQAVDVYKPENASWEGLRKYIEHTYPDDKSTSNYSRRIGASTGTIFRFVNEAKPNDFVWHYDTTDGHAYLAKIISAAKLRDQSISDDSIDIWHIREVELGPSIPLIHLHGDILASLRFPKQTFWNMDNVQEKTTTIWNNRFTDRPKIDSSDIQNAYKELVRLMQKHLTALNYNDWEILTKEFVEKQGGKIRGRVGGNREGIDVEAVFSVVCSLSQ